MKKDYKVYIKLFAIFLFVLLILQTIRLDGFQDLNQMVDSQGIVITSPASVPMTTSQTVADPEVAAASQQAIASASAAYAQLQEAAPQFTTRTTYVEPTFNESTRAPPVFLSRPAETPPVTAPVIPPPVTPPPVTAPVIPPPVTAPVIPPPVTAPVIPPPVTAPVTPLVTPPVTPPPVTPPPVTPSPVIPPRVTAPVIPPATNTITQATANASALAATAAGSTSTSTSQVTPLATDTTVTSTTTYILIGIIAVGGIATATVLINAK